MRFLFILLFIGFSLLSNAQNVGIGTISPASHLHIANADTVEFRLDNTNTGSGGRSWAITSAPTTTIPSFRIIDRSSALTRFSISNDGYVGIGLGNANASAPLQVGGDILVNGISIGRGGSNYSQNTALGKNALLNNYNLAIHCTAIGYNTLPNNSGQANTAIGYAALAANTGGFSNTAVGSDALGNNLLGQANAALGAGAGSTIYGNANTFIGCGANFSSASSTNGNTLIGYATNAYPGLTNATAIGANARVGQDNSMVLGSINGINGATADTKVGIGTITPTASLDVQGSIRTSYSGTVVTASLSTGVQTVNLTIPSVPAGWDAGNTAIVITNVDGGEGVIRQAKLTSTTNIAVKYEALTSGQVRFNYVFFKL